jgi:CheY-like chemotaxis protein
MSTIFILKTSSTLLTSLQVNQKLGVKMLTMLNYDTLLAENGQEAVDIVKEHAQTIDAILMDQSMPIKDGISATIEIREMEAVGILCKRQIIIACTAAAGPEANSVFAKAGTDMFLSKPFTLVKLEQALSHYFNE